MNIITSRRIAAHYIYYRRSLLRNPILSLSADGTVTGIEFCDRPDREAGVEFYSGILIPPLVNAHCHLELSYLNTHIPEGTGFVGFADKLGKIRNAFPQQERIGAAALQDAFMWNSGVGAVGDVCNGDSTFNIKATSGIRYHNFLELFGLNTSTAEPLKPSAAAAESLGLEYCITPHSTYSLNREGFAAAVRGLEGQSEGMPLSIHFMESAAEGRLFRGEGEMSRWYASRGMTTDFTHYRSPAGRIVAQVPADRGIMLVHNCFVTEEDVDRITDHFAGKVTWVLCPRSNLFISRVVPPYNMLRKKGVKIALGTDSAATNHSLDMIEEMKMFSGVPLIELLEWVSPNGARALGIEEFSEGFETGRKTGAVILSGIDWGTMSLTPDSKTRRIV